MIVKSDGLLYLNRDYKLYETSNRNDNKYKMIFNMQPNNLYRVENREIEFGANEILMLSPFMQHNQLEIKDQKFLVEIDPKFVMNIKDGLNTDFELFDMPLLYSTQLFNDLKRMAEILASDVSGTIKEKYLNSLVTQLLINHMAQDLFESNESELVKIEEYIDKNYCDDLSLVSMATALGYSKYHLIKLFKMYFNLTPIEYLNRIRIQKSLSMIRNKQINLTEVSYRVGYNSYSQFSRWFKYYMLVNPSQYEERYRR